MSAQENIARTTQPSRASSGYDIDIRNTRYAVLWARTRSLGDDVQTLATMHALAKLGIHEYTFIERESMHQYQGPPVTMVMNGWFTKIFEHPPPPDTITPIFIGFHGAQDYFVRLHVEYFKKHEPIGCRDMS